MMLNSQPVTKNFSVLLFKHQSSHHVKKRRRRRRRRRRRIMNSFSIWFCSNSSKNLFVKIVHPGGHIELHDRPILAAELLNRNPKCCVAYPTVFQQPHAIVPPETILNLGQKYYVVPINTIKKLQLKSSPFVAEENQPASSQESDKNQHTACKNDDDNDETGSFCWMFRNSKNGAELKNSKHGSLFSPGIKLKSSSSEISKEEMMNFYGKKRVNKRNMENYDNSTGNLSPGRISLTSYDNWQPNLKSITETYN